MTTTTNTAWAPASEKQNAFLRDLLDTRVLPEWVATLKDRITDQITFGTLEKKSASSLIDALMSQPRKPKASAKTSSSMQALLASVPKSKYAVPVFEAEDAGATDSFRGDLVFLEIKEYMQTLYMRQLHGAPGSFNRTKMTTESVKALIEIIAKDPYKYAKKFGEHYTCCGSCGAELTDETSRALMLGPECRKKFSYS